jgi:hypothetical protein
VYVTDTTSRLVVIDARGEQSCSGTPKVCQPLWMSSPVVTTMDQAAPVVVAEGKAFVVRGNGLTADLAAFDASGATGCGGTPKLCAPLWRTPIGGNGAAWSLAVADGRVFVPQNVVGNNTTEAYDANGAGCSGSPMVCPRLFKLGSFGSTVAIVNGLAVKNMVGGTAVWDLANLDCPAGNCVPAATNSVNANSGFIVGGGRFFGVSIDGNGNATLLAAW